jgi:hypothetical protein
MEKVGIHIFEILLVILAVLGILYFLNVPITQVAGESIGFADLVNFFFFQQPPNLPEVSAESNAEIAAWVSQMDGNDVGDSARMLATLGNPIRFCVFRDNNYCQNFRLEGGKMFKTEEAAQRTVYVSYALAFQIKQMVETQDLEDLERRLVQGIKKGEVKGLTIDDVMKIGE